MLKKLTAWLGGVAVAGLLATSASAADTIKIALIEPLSGPMAAIGEEARDAFEFGAAKINAQGGVLGRDLEIVLLDNAMSAEKTTQLLKKAADDGIGYIIQGIGSNHALNIIQFLNKHNKRNPDNRIIFLNHSAVTTAFTNELCSFWHFRFDANVDMKVAALVTQLSRPDSGVKKVYLLNQNYAFGKSVQGAARAMLAERAPNIEVVGDELIAPFGKVQDFTPFIAKIKDSGADTILTGNWGADLVRFVKTAAASGLPAKFYTFYGGITSSVAAFGEDALKVPIKQVSEFHENHDGLPADVVDFSSGYTDQYKSSWYSDRQRWVLLMLAGAMEKAGSTDPVAVGKALEGMTLSGPLGEIEMRADDHQIQTALLISSISPDAQKSIMYQGRDFGVAFASDGIVSRADTTLPTTCEMDRP